MALDLPQDLTIRLFEAEPDLARFLPAPEQDEARLTELPVCAVPRGVLDVQDLFQRTRSFGLLVLDGMLLQSVRLWGQQGLRVLGPGDLLSLTTTPRSTLVVDAGCRATVPTRVALFERELLLATRRWPGLVAGLHARSGEQAERLVIQLMICQLPRVEDRLLSMMWLLAESWGHVTAAGTTLSVAFTHEALGGLIGARRPTVSLAVRELTETGTILRRDGGWLLIKAPRTGLAGQLTAVDDPQLLSRTSTSWAGGESLLATGEPIRTALLETVKRLRVTHERSVEQYRERVSRTAATRELVTQRRSRMASAELSPERAPSS